MSANEGMKPHSSSTMASSSHFETPKAAKKAFVAQSAHHDSIDGSQKIKRTYKKKRLGEFSDYEKPPPKKRGRKSKKELLMMAKKDIVSKKEIPFLPPDKIKKAKKQGLYQKIAKKSTLPKAKKPHVSNVGPSAFDKKILAGPHLTMKQVLDYILTDHSYCIPPDPLPAVGSNHQMIRYILGPSNGAKARVLPIYGVLDSGDRSPLIYSSIPRSKGQLNLSSTPPQSSKLEHLLKRNEGSPLGFAAIRFSQSRSITPSSEFRDESDVEVDVETVESDVKVSYDAQKANEVMTECEKYVEFARGDDTGDDWESKIIKTGWTKTQTNLFDKVVGAMHSERLSRLAYEKIGDSEPALRRASIDLTASRVRRIFGEYLWDSKLTQWVHGVLMENLNYAYLAVYLDILQTLRSRCPKLVSKMLSLTVSLPLVKASHEDELVNLLTPFLHSAEESNGTNEFTFTPDGSIDPENEASPYAMSNSESRKTKSDEGIVPKVKDVMMNLRSAKHAEALKALLERQWDPFAPVIFQRMKKLSSNPVFLMIAPCSIFPKFSLNRRLKQYYIMFRRIGKIVTVSTRHPEFLGYTSVNLYMEKMMYMAKEKVKQIRHAHPDRPLYLVGWGSGSVLAARLSASSGPIDGIIALGFPLIGLKSGYEDLLRVFTGLKHPILFVIGGLASNNSLTDMELFRRRLPCETSLVVLGTANENLFVSRVYREKLLITQSYVDKTIVDEVSYFVNLHSKHNQMSASITTNISMKPNLPKPQTFDPASKKLSNSRGHKRSSSCISMDGQTTPTEENKNMEEDREKEISPESPLEPPSLGPVSVKRENEVNTPIYDYDFDGPKFIPSNKSSSKRKAYYRPDPSSVSLSATSSNCITASKLVQQSPNAKRRISKPSGPTTSPRVPLLGQQQIQRSNSQSSEINDDQAGSMRFQDEGNIMASTTDSPTQTTLNNMTKHTKKKPSTKPKSTKFSKDTPNFSPVALTSPMTDAGTPVGNPSALGIHKYVLQHPHMVTQLGPSRPDTQTSPQLFKLLSPGDSNSLTSGLPQGSELLKLKLIGSQPITPDMLESRTTMISKQSLVSNMSLPLIRLGKPDDPKHVTIAGLSSSTFIANLPSDSSKHVMVTSNDKSVVLNAADLRNLISGAGTGIQVVSGFSNLPTQGSVNVILKKTSDSSEIITKPQTIPVKSITTNVDTVPHSLPKTNESHVSKSRVTLTPSSSTAVKEVVPVIDANPVIDSGVSKDACHDSPEPSENEIEPMDTEEEMSGLLISSTFSVCPKSGERVVATPVTDSSKLDVNDANSKSDLNPNTVEQTLNVDLPVSTFSTPIAPESTKVLTPSISPKALASPKESLEDNTSLPETTKESSSNLSDVVPVQTPEADTKQTPVADTKQSPVVDTNETPVADTKQTPVNDTIQNVSIVMKENSKLSDNLTSAPIEPSGSSEVNETESMDVSEPATPPTENQEGTATYEDTGEISSNSADENPKSNKPLRRSARLKSGV